MRHRTSPSLLLLLLLLLLPTDYSAFALGRLPLLPAQRQCALFATSIPKPTIITPATGKQHPQLEKFLMMYTCKICTGRNAQMISKVAYNHGMVVSTCRHCKSKHLIADNEGKLDMKEYGRKIEDYLEQKKERIQRITVTPQDLEDNYLVDTDGVISLVSKMGGQPSVDVTIIDMPVPGAPLPPIPPAGPSGGGGGFKTERIS